MAGQSIREIRRRIGSVRSTSQITRAMEMVAVAKLRQIQAQLGQARPFAQRLAEVAGRLLADPGLQGRLPGIPPEVLSGRSAVRRIAYVVFTSDRGLAGGYNLNLLRFAQAQIPADAEAVRLYCLGRKGQQFFRRAGRAFQSGPTQMGDRVSFVSVRQLSGELWEAFRSGQVDQVELIYQQFLGVGRSRPVRETLLPLVQLVRPRLGATVASPPAAGEAGQREQAHQSRESPPTQEYIYVPSRAQVLATLLPRLVDHELYRVWLDAKASEYGARRTAMHQATENAEEMMRHLQLAYNKARQAAITKELLEIVAGAEALTGGGGQ